MGTLSWDPSDLRGEQREAECGEVQAFSWRPAPSPTLQGQLVYLLRKLKCGLEPPPHPLAIPLDCSIPCGMPVTEAIGL